MSLNSFEKNFEKNLLIWHGMTVAESFEVLNSCLVQSSEELCSC